MSQSIIGREILRLDCIDSTNSYLMRLAAEGAPEGLVVIADRQTAGRGRRGRSFQSTGGLGLYLSVLVRPDLPAIDVPELTAWTAVAVCDGIEAACGKRPKVKWINDLIAENRKLGGILTELALNPDGTLSHVVVGIGINVSHKREDFDPELQDMATSLSRWLGQAFDRDTLAHHVITALDEMYRHFPHDRQGFLSRYRADCVTLGQPVRVLAGNAATPAVAEAIDDHFRLLVRYGDGSTAALNSGEVSVRGLWDYV
ncbi:MAG: biotin--[Oscillospiraceae bacterium]|nr:biotin--[acetyl-CoA-carboxylase] ligase [Oscillospiraceae bacterium]